MFEQRLEKFLWSPKKLFTISRKTSNSWLVNADVREWYVYLKILFKLKQR